MEGDKQKRGESKNEDGSVLGKENPMSIPSSPKPGNTRRGAAHHGFQRQVQRLAVSRKRPIRARTPSPNASPRNPELCYSDT